MFVCARVCVFVSSSFSLSLSLYLSFFSLCPCVYVSVCMSWPGLDKLFGACDIQSMSRHTGQVLDNDNCTECLAEVCLVWQHVLEVTCHGLLHCGQIEELPHA